MLGFNEFQQIADKRLEEAKVLLNAGHPDGCFYLAGYVIECAIKARICKVLEWDNYPPKQNDYNTFKTHDLDRLINLAGLSKKLDIKKLANQEFDKNWSLIKSWDETIRYKPIGNKQLSEATATIKAIEDVNDGVLTWIKSTW